MFTHDIAHCGQYNKYRKPPHPQHSNKTRSNSIQVHVHAKNPGCLILTNNQTWALESIYINIPTDNKGIQIVVEAKIFLHTLVTSNKSNMNQKFKIKSKQKSTNVELCSL